MGDIDAIRARADYIHRYPTIINTANSAHLVDAVHDRDELLQKVADLKSNLRRADKLAQTYKEEIGRLRSAIRVSPFLEYQAALVEIADLEGQEDMTDAKFAEQTLLIVGKALQQ